MAARVGRPPRMRGTDLRDNEDRNSFRYRRAAMLEQLRQQRDPALVFVRYHPQHWDADEWVYNEPVIDEAHVIWARELSTQQDRELIDHFNDRTAYLLLADGELGDPFKAPPLLLPYEEGVERFGPYDTWPRSMSAPSQPESQ